MRQNSFSASEQIETSSLGFPESPRASCAGVQFNSSIIKENMQIMMWKRSQCPAMVIEASWGMHCPGQLECAAPLLGFVSIWRM